MSDAIELCGISSENSTNMEQLQINNYYFDFNNSKLPINLNTSQDNQIIKDIAKTCQHSNLHKFGLSLAFNEQNRTLSFVYTNVERRTPHKDLEISLILGRIFNVMTTKFRKQDDLYLLMLQNTCERANNSQLLKTYITTQLYDALYTAHKRDLPADMSVEALSLPASFTAKLFNFQIRTVHWLLQQERNAGFLPSFWMTLLTKCHKTIFKHKYCLRLEDSLPQPVSSASGGILADEMGLGKTLEILALITLNPRTIDYEQVVSEMLAQNNISQPTMNGKKQEKHIFCLCNTNKPNKSALVECGRCKRWQHGKCVREMLETNECQVSSYKYRCPECWHEMTAAQPLATRATIIVSPNSIRAQWLSEVKRHAPALRVCCYDARTWINPIDLGDHDLILTDYPVLRSEVYHTDEFVSTRKTRNAPRSMRRFTPLLMLQWYRVCLDEAQMVESNTSQVAAMARSLPAVHRWAVTGTPIQSSINDLMPLLKFIGLHEVCYPPEIWKTLTYHFLMACNSKSAKQTKMIEGQPLIKMLKCFMWRTCKKNIKKELILPPQEETVHLINLMDLEKLNYMEQHADQEKEFMNVIIKHYNTGNEWGVNDISPQILRVLLQPLQNMRQCCTLATIGNKKPGHVLGIDNQRFLQPRELMIHMKSVNEMECKTALRNIASSINGMAAAKMLYKEYAAAVDIYKHILTLASEFTSSKICVDSLLQIHAIYNMLEANTLLKSSEACFEEGVLSTTEVSQYEEQFYNLENKYLGSYKEIVNNVKINYDKTKDDLVNDCEKKLLEDVSDLIDDLDNEQSNILFNRLCVDRRTIYPNADKYESVNTYRGLLLLLNKWVEELRTKRAGIVESLKKLDFFTQNIGPKHLVNEDVYPRIIELVRSVYNCHLSSLRTENKDNNNKEATPPPKKKLKKDACILCVIGKQLNAYFCLLYDQEITKGDETRKGIERSGVEVHIMRTILNFMRGRNKSSEKRNHINQHLETLDTLQAFYHRTSKYWIEVEYTVKAYDELDMCKMRTSVTNDKDNKSQHCILDCELEAYDLSMQLLCKEAESVFSRKYGRLRYLDHLSEKTDHGPCPICCTEIQTRYAVLECGHHVCLDCLKHWRKQAINSQLNCIMCRNSQLASNVFYVTKTIEKETGLEGVYSTKITYVLRLLLKLREQDASVKVLIFSQWKAILDAMANSLANNNISFRMQVNPKNLDHFKDAELNIMCLLMPLQSGSKGLNLVEATHVFLLEPILNPGEELQALSRVHRFGQTKPTMVHRFIATNTIEENIHNLIKTKNSQGTNWEFENLSLWDLQKLFVLENDITDQS